MSRIQQTILQFTEIKLDTSIEKVHSEASYEECFVLFQTERQQTREDMNQQLPEVWCITKAADINGTTSLCVL